MTEDYVCRLDEASLSKAKKELGEDPKERPSQVETLRKWVKEQPHINCPTDSAFLLRFLRTGKFSQLKARGILEKSLQFKSENPKWGTGIDPLRPSVLAFLKTGYFLPLPNKLPTGEKILLVRQGAIDPDCKDYSVDDVFRGIFVLLVYMLVKDENITVNGVRHFMDYTGVTMKHQTYWTLDTIKKSLQSMQGGTPVRFKGFHTYNHGPVFEAIMTLAKPFMSKKFKDRMHLHGSNLESMYKLFPKNLLPDEYLPDDYNGPSAGPTQKVIDDLVADVCKPEMRQIILEETKEEYGYDKSKIIPMKKSESQTSFRKLNVE